MEERTSTQIIDTGGLRKLVEKDGMKSATGARAVRILRHISENGGILHQRYVRAKKKKGRWYATGIAQLQSAPKIVRRAACGRVAWECDLENAFPSILVNLLPQAPGRWPILREYAANKHPLRSDVAEAFDIPIKDAKTLLLSVIFGRSIHSWRSNRPEVTGPTPAKLLQLCDELTQARALLTNGIRWKGESRLSALSRRIQVAERGIMDRLEVAFAENDFDTGTIVHDALILQRKDKRQSSSEDRGVIIGIAERTLAEIAQQERWAVPLRFTVLRPGG
jgi:hypothetical protein